MGNLKSENVKKCFSLLREFIKEAEALSNQKGIAILALNHLQNTIAGKDSPGASLRLCMDIPRIDG